uniref:Uncharacterized protein n=1 Tax=Rhizophora mucronata TaxID=61149 RepID=A0A2P2NBT6_RHIMU
MYPFLRPLDHCPKYVLNISLHCIRS